MMKDADELIVQKSVLNVHICYVICDKFLFLLGIFYDYCLQISANNVLNNLTWSTLRLHSQSVMRMYIIFTVHFTEDEWPETNTC